MSPFLMHLDEYQRLIEFLPDAIVLHKNGNFVCLNQTAFQLLGIDQRKDDWQNKTIFDFIHPVYHEAAIQRSKETTQKGVVSKIEYRLNQMTGEQVDIECTSILFDYIDEPCILSVLRNITEKKRMVHQLEMSELWYKSLFKYHPDGIYSLDLDNRFVSTNPALEKYIGQKEEELVGESFVPYVIPSDLECTFLHLEKAKQGEVQRYDIQMRGLNGDTFDMNITNIPIIVDGLIVGIYGIAKDMTPTKRAERDLQESEEKHRIITENSFDIVVILDKEGIITYASPSHEYYLGYTVEEVMGKPGIGFIFEEDLPRAEDALNTLIVKKIPVSIELRYKRKDSSPIWLEIKGIPFLDKKQEFQTAVMVARDITERKTLKEELTYTAFHDALTGLTNRWKFEEELQAAITHNQKSNQKLALLYLDMDRFKIVNDTLGHDIGDLLLKQVAERLKQTVRKKDVIARMGGDEFAVLLSEIRNTDEAAEITQRILSTVRERFYIKGNEIHMTMSIGISVFPHDGKDIVNLLKCAESALYRAKEEGKNNYKLCTSTDGKQKCDQLRFENHLRKAIQNRELFIYYQPRVGLQSNRIEGVEALIRWKHPHWGIISPAEFIPVAEETGLIIPIGRWVMETACEQNKKWQEKGFQPIRVSVNLSMRQFLSSSLTDTISSILKKTGLDPQWLELEITESMMMKDVSFTVEVLNEIKKMGVHISIDDFGTGYSSLSYLKKLPIDTLKIDRSFIQDIPKDEDNMAITTSIISMGKHLKKKVVAEGVEEESQVQFLLEQGCHEYQGFYCSRPTDPERIELFLNK